MSNTKTVVAVKKKSYQKNQKTVFITKSHYIGEKSIVQAFEPVLTQNILSSRTIFTEKNKAETDREAAAI